MASFTEAKNRILAKTPLDALIGEHVKLDKRSGKRMACCPFHAEKTPSFYVYDDHYHCFGCSAHGDAISFVQHVQGLGFVESLRWLGKKYQIDTPELDRTSGQIKQWQKEASNSKLLLLAQDFFQSQLHQPEAAEIKAYLLDRGFSENSIKEFGFGYAPNMPNALQKYLLTHKADRNQLESTSLITVYQGKSYDFFRHRLTIPIHDTHGKIIAFGGRAVGSQRQKYKNSRYDKSLILFGLNHARTKMRSKGRAIIVEGYLDALQLRQRGFEETVACQGTALTKDHLRSLKSATKRVYLLFDGDKAGQAASLKTIQIALDFPELSFHVASLPEGEDPDSFVQSQGPEKLEQVLESAEDLLSYGIKQKLQDTHETAIPTLISEEFVPWLKTVSDQIKLNFLAQKISSLTGVPSQTIVNSVKHKLSPLNGASDSFSSPSRTIAEHANEPLTKSQISPRLEGITYELCGHLYFSGPEDVAVEELRAFIKTELKCDQLWLLFVEELLNCLSKGRSPVEESLSSWTSGHSHDIMSLVQRLQQSKHAFVCENRQKQLARIQLVQRKMNLSKVIESLKSELGRVSVTTPSGKNQWQTILMEISKLDLKTAQISSELRSM